jgi:ribosomal protein L37AE/L43A
MTFIDKENIKKTKEPKKIKVKEDYFCDQCGKTFKDRGNMKSHIRVKHEQKKIFKCKHCGKSYSYKRGLRTHRTEAGKCKGSQKENKWIKVVYMSSNIVQLTVGSRDLSQAERKMTIIFTQNDDFFHSGPF